MKRFIAPFSYRNRAGTSFFYKRLHEKMQSEYTHGAAEVEAFGKSIRSTSKKEWMSIIKFQDLAGREVEVYAVREKEN